MVRTALAYVAALVAIGVMDFVWLRLVAMDWYQAGMGHLMAPSPNVLGAALFYVLFPVGVVLFVAMPAGGDAAKALVMGALFGVFCYGTFDLTSLAVLRGFPGWLAALDIAWGAVVSAVGALAATLAWRAITP
ncbi:MAG: DUF2177 family protein [Ramlibacter sp.]